MQINKNLTVIRLPDNAIPDEGILALTDCLAKNTTITELNIAGNRCGAGGTAGIVTLLINKASKVLLWLMIQPFCVQGF